MVATATLNLIMFVMPALALLSRFLLTIETGGARFSIVGKVSGFGGCLSVVLLIMLCFCPARIV